MAEGALAEVGPAVAAREEEALVGVATATEAAVKLRAEVEPAMVVVG